MAHDVTHKLTRQIKGVKMEFRITAPVLADVDDLCSKADALMEKVVKDPNQLGLSFTDDPDGGE